jgi:hypothetical protein
MNYDHFLDVEHERHFKEECPECECEICECDYEEDFDEPDDYDCDSCDVCFGGVDW